MSESARGRADDEALLALALRAGLLAPEDLAAARAADPGAQVDWLVANDRLSETELQQMTALLDAAMRRRMQATLPPLEPADGDRPPPTHHGAERPGSGAMAVPDRIGPYAISAVLGQGAMGTVYRGRRDGSTDDIALKVLRADVLSPAVIARFRREAEAAQALADHPAIAGVTEIGVSDGRTWFAMDLIEGVTLDRIIQGGELDMMRAACILRDVARGVHYAHVEGILHRDLKPGNILIDPHDRPHVVDFGLATRQAADEASARLTRTGELIGTPAYMAPEQVQNTAVDVRADIYALGATLFDALCGQPPFVGSTSYEILRQVTTAEPPLARERNPLVPAPLEVIAAKCLRRDPAERYATAEEMADDLDRFVRAQPIRARRESRVQRVARRVRRNPAPWLVGSVAVAVVLVGLVVMTILRVRAQQAINQELHLAAELCASDPERALGMLESIGRRAPSRRERIAELRSRAESARQRLAQASVREQAATLLTAARAAAARHAKLHEEWELLKEADDDALRRELGGANPDHDPDQAARRTRLATVGPERDAAYAAALSAAAGAVQVCEAAPEAEERQAAAALAAQLAHTRLAAAEARFDRAAADRFARDLAAHGTATHPEAIAGDGTLSLDTVPSGATVRVGRYEEIDGVLVARAERVLGQTPLDRVPLAMGSWLCVIEGDGAVPVRYPVCIERQEAHAVRTPIVLLSDTQIGDGFIYVPGGWSILGNDGKARTAWPAHREWVDGFLIGRDEVTVGEYAAYLEDLLARGVTEAEVQRRVPRQNPRSDFLWRVQEGRIERHELMSDPATPVSGLAWDDAMEYCAWRSQRDGRRYRMPTSEEFQRAGRGADGRRYPWGTVFDWRRCVGGRWPGHEGRRAWSAPGGSAADDTSPFGVRDLCGNLEEWIHGTFQSENARGRRGGCWGLGGLIDFHLANHGTAGRSDTNITRGFRLRCDAPTK